MPKRVLITGGAGFIGINAAKYFLDNGCEISIIDNLSRKGTDNNLDWLQEYGDINFHQLDIREYQPIKQIIQDFNPNLVLHLAAQVAVTTSVIDPRTDFEINSLGTFNLLEAIRETGQKPALIYTSTNKVYGKLNESSPLEQSDRYILPEYPYGIPENLPLDFYSPYGCSKGSADQYVRDYSRIYGIPAVVFRQSCIYGRRQFGIEDQGWVAWFIIASILKKPITIFGNGKQVRDILFIDDLINAFDLAWKHIDRTQGKVYNIGGGPENSISLLEFFKIIGEILGYKPIISYSDWRPGDQPVYISNIDKIKNDTGWEPNISVDQGVKILSSWVEENQDIIEKVLSK